MSCVLIGLVLGPCGALADDDDDEPFVVCRCVCLLPFGVVVAGVLLSSVICSVSCVVASILLRCSISLRCNVVLSAASVSSAVMRFSVPLIEQIFVRSINRCVNFVSAFQGL